MKIIKLFSIQLLTLLINVATGVIITRSSNFEIRSNISLINAWLSFTLILFNQSRFEQVLKTRSDFIHQKWVIRSVSFLVISLVAIPYLEISFWLSIFFFLYLFINTTVQFRGTQIIKNFGNIFFLKINLFFYVINFIQIIMLVFFNMLDAKNWLITSIFGDLILIILYSYYMKIKVKDIAYANNILKEKFSYAAVVATLIESGLVLIANQFVGPREISFLVVALSCISPISIFYGPIQNYLLLDRWKTFKRFSDINNILKLFFFIAFSIGYYFSLKLGIPIIFGHKYSQLSDYSLLIILMGYLLIVFKFFNTLLRISDNGMKSVFLTILLLLCFSILCALIPNSDIKLILAALLSLTFSLLSFGLMRSIRNDLLVVLFKKKHHDK